MSGSVLWALFKILVFRACHGGVFITILSVLWKLRAPKQLWLQSPGGDVSWGQLWILLPFLLTISHRRREAGGGVLAVTVFPVQSPRGGGEIWIATETPPEVLRIVFLMAPAPGILQREPLSPRLKASTNCCISSWECLCPWRVTGQNPGQGERCRGWRKHLDHNVWCWGHRHRAPL
jgi:hypothetical protein